MGLTHRKVCRELKPESAIVYSEVSPTVVSEASSQESVDQLFPKVKLLNGFKSKNSSVSGLWTKEEREAGSRQSPSSTA